MAEIEIQIPDAKEGLRDADQGGLKARLRVGLRVQLRVRARRLRGGCVEAAVYRW